jgi:hypothetical protein
MMKPDFEDYFRGQYGKRPIVSRAMELDLQDKVRQGLEAQRILNECKEWDIARDACVFAWETCKLRKGLR